MGVSLLSFERGASREGNTRCAMKTILLIYRQPELGEAWHECFSAQPGIRILEGDITAAPCDAVVSPANSFGFMDGGLDLALCERFGWQLQDALQREIRALPIGELRRGGDRIAPLSFVLRLCRSRDEQRAQAANRHSHARDTSRSCGRSQCKTSSLL